MSSSADRFRELAALESNWDSYGAVVINPECIRKARELYYRQHGDWSIVPCSDGSVQLEQHVDGFDIEILISRSAKEET